MKVRVMEPDICITRWICAVRAGEPEGAEHLWRRYFGPMVDLARRQLSGRCRTTADEEDVALSAFKSLCRGLAQGRFPQLNREALWPLLAALTSHKGGDLIRRVAAVKRGGAMMQHAADVKLDQFPDGERGPDLELEQVEECQRLLDALRDTVLCSIALWKMEGFSNEEIAAKLGCSPRTVERKLQVIRGLWEGALQS